MLRAEIIRQLSSVVRAGILQVHRTMSERSEIEAAGTLATAQDEVRKRTVAILRMTRVAVGPQAAPYWIGDAAKPVRTSLRVHAGMGRSLSVAPETLVTATAAWEA